MGFYRKRPIIIEAYQITRNTVADIVYWVDAGTDAVRGWDNGDACYILISTLEGIMRADELDWVIRGVAGEFYPCKPEIFEKTYELAV
jgi:hypothetical protein